MSNEVRMTESCAIPQYVVHRCGGPQSTLAVRPEEPDYAELAEYYQKNLQ